MLNYYYQLFNPILCLKYFVYHPILSYHYQLFMYPNNIVLKISLYYPILSYHYQIIHAIDRTPWIYLNQQWSRHILDVLSPKDIDATFLQNVHTLRIIWFQTVWWLMIRNYNMEYQLDAAKLQHVFRICAINVMINERRRISVGRQDF